MSDIETDLWTEATRDAEAEELDRRLTSARLAAADLWPVLASSTSPSDYANRKELIADRLDRIATAAADNDPAGFAIVRSKLEAEFDRDFQTLHAERQQEAAKEAQVRKRIEATTKQKQATRKKAITYGELPESAGNTGIACANGDCEAFAILYSATRGDYFMADRSETVTCGECGEPMSLASQRSGIDFLSRRKAGKQGRPFRGPTKTSGVAKTAVESIHDFPEGTTAVCVQCGEPILLDQREGGGPGKDWGARPEDWVGNGGIGMDYGCSDSPLNDDEGTGGHSPKAGTISPPVTASRKTAAPSDGQRSYCRICGVEMEGMDYAWYALSASSPKRNVGEHHHLPARNADWPGEFNAQGDLVPGTPGGGGGQYDAPAGTIYDAGANPISVTGRREATRKTAASDYYEHKSLGQREGFDIDAYLSHDSDYPSPATEHQDNGGWATDADVASWENDDWNWAILTVEVSKDGRVLADASIGGIASGLLAGKWADGIEGAGYTEDLTLEALAEAKNYLARNAARREGKQGRPFVGRSASKTAGSSPNAILDRLERVRTPEAAWAAMEAIDEYASNIAGPEKKRLVEDAHDLIADLMYLTDEPEWDELVQDRIDAARYVLRGRVDASKRKTSVSFPDRWIADGSDGSEEYEAEGIGEAWVRPDFDNLPIEATEPEGWKWDAFSYDALPQRGHGIEATQDAAKTQAEEWIIRNSVGEQTSMFARKHAAVPYYLTFWDSASAKYQQWGPFDSAGEAEAKRESLRPYWGSVTDSMSVTTQSADEINRERYPNDPVRASKTATDMEHSRVRRVDTTSLQAGDQFFNPGVGQMNYVDADGNVSSALPTGLGPMRGGVLWTVISNEGGVLTARREDGEVISGTIPSGSKHLKVVGTKTSFNFDKDKADKPEPEAEVEGDPEAITTDLPEGFPEGACGEASADTYCIKVTDHQGKHLFQSRGWIEQKLGTETEDEDVEVDVEIEEKVSHRKTAEGYFSLGVVYTPDGEKLYLAKRGLVSAKASAERFGFFESAEQWAWSFGVNAWGEENLGPVGGIGGNGTWNYYAEVDYSQSIAKKRASTIPPSAEPQGAGIPRDYPADARYKPVRLSPHRGADSRRMWGVWTDEDAETGDDGPIADGMTMAEAYDSANHWNAKPFLAPDHSQFHDPSMFGQFGARRQAANPYTPENNPYTPGTPDDMLDGPPDPQVSPEPQTTRPRQMPGQGDEAEMQEPETVGPGNSTGTVPPPATARRSRRKARA